MKKANIVLVLFFIFFISMGSKDIKNNSKAKLRKVTVTGHTARMDINNIDLALTNDGQTGNDADSFYPNGSDLSFLFSGGVCFSGYIEGDLRTAWMAPASRIQEMQPGNWGSDPDAPEYIFYSVNSSDSLGSENYIKWADAVATGADYYDADGDGSYDPNIDTPDIIGDRTFWCVYNDSVPASIRDVLNTQALGLEVRQSIWAFQRSDALGDAIFIRYSVVNASENDIDDLIISGWTDPDLGGATDDLIGCDTTLGMGYIYNFQDDSDYGANPPAFGIDIMQGAVVDAPGKTAYKTRGPLLGVDTLNDKKNLSLTSLITYEGGGNILPGPTNKNIARNYQLGGLDANNDPVVPQDWGIGGDSDSDVRYFFSGDPVTQTGWLDIWSADKRFLVNSGPFQLKAGERQDIVMAYIVTQGEDALGSVTKLKETSALVQSSFDNNFQVAPPIPVPDVTVRSADREIELVIDFTKSFNYQNKQDLLGKVDFEGLAIYQFNSPSTADEVNGIENAKIIGRFDLDNDIGDLFEDQENAERIKIWSKQGNLNFVNFEQADAAILKYTVTTDAFDNESPLVNAKPYYFAVVPFGINRTLSFENEISQTEDDYVLVEGLYEADREAGFITATAGTSLFTPYNSAQAEKTGGSSQGSVFIDVVEHDQVSGDEYEITFFD
ncbi:MAG: hypothetical protein D8M58_22340, partial [Calditrichaeota bacterium]|nr:hypothetical protein [Calditrichota bacterium]NOG47993.1 hypothetical protein [Calditrichota bacterium]